MRSERGYESVYHEGGCVDGGPTKCIGKFKVSYGC